MPSYAVTVRAIAQAKAWVKVVNSESIEAPNIMLAITIALKGSPITPEGKDGIIYETRVQLIK